MNPWIEWSLNRTIVGLKLDIDTAKVYEFDCLNRTIVGLKSFIHTVASTPLSLFESNYSRIEILLMKLEKQVFHDV